MPFAVLVNVDGNGYDLRGLPEQLVTRLEAAKQHTYPDRRDLTYVPINEMLNWIEASGWTLHSASAGEKRSQLYVFHASSIPRRV
jgi:hypothetical protein